MKRFLCVVTEEDKEKLINNGFKLMDSQSINGRDYFYFLNDKKIYEQYDMKNVKHFFTDILFV